jgi:hypothetical protein
MFLTSRKPEYAYKFLVYACKLNAEQELNKSLNLNILKLSQFPEIKFLFFLFYLLFSKKIFNKETRTYISYENLEIGRFALSETFKNFSCYTSKYFFYKKFFFNLYKAGVIIKSLKIYFYSKNKETIKAAYIDHCSYLNGIIFNFLSKKKIIVYTNNYPKSIFKFIGRKSKASNVTYEDVLKIKNKIKILDRKKSLLAKNILAKIHLNNNYLPWMNNTEFSQSKKININSANYVIYAHSFTDGQLIYGNDGFENTLDWLNFTIDHLRKKSCNIIVKSHPNFYQTNLGEKSTYDAKIFAKIKNRYEKDLSIKFLDGPFPNNKLLKKLDSKKTVLISHHGSVLLEAAYSGFKTISSHSTFFDTKFKISNFWTNKKEYLSLLNKSHNSLKFANNNDLLKLVYCLFYDNSGHFSNVFWEKIVCKELNITFEEFYKKIVFLGNKEQTNKNFLENRLTSILFSKIIKKLSKNISDETVH